MPYTDFRDVIQDDADAIRYIEGSTASIIFQEMPNRILGINGGIRFDSTDSSQSWVSKFLPYITGSEYITDMSYMFYMGKIAGNPDFSNFGTAAATNMAHMFNYCNYYTSLDLSLDLSNFDTSNVTDMEAMFQNCNANSLDLSSFDTSSVLNMRAMFSYCSMTQLDLSSFDTSNVTDMTAMFGGFSGIMWVPSTFVATAVTRDDNKPFYRSATSAEVYTDATDAETQGWGTVHSSFTIHYNSTHQDYLNAISQ